MIIYLNCFTLSKEDHVINLFLFFCIHIYIQIFFRDHFFNNSYIPIYLKNFILLYRKIINRDKS